MATYIDALNNKHSDGSEQFSSTITVLVKNIQYFKYKVHIDRADEIGNLQEIIDLDFNPLAPETEQVSEDCYEFIEILKETRNMSPKIHNNHMQKLVGSRYTISELERKLCSLIVNKIEQLTLEPFEENLPEKDWGFNINLGELEGHYYDYEIFMLPTSNPHVWIITEINPF